LEKIKVIINNSKFAPYKDNITALVLATLLLHHASYNGTPENPLLLCCFGGFLVGKKLGCLSGCLDNTWRIESGSKISGTD